MLSQDACDIRLLLLLLMSLITSLSVVLVGSTEKLWGVGAVADGEIDHHRCCWWSGCFQATC